MTHEWKTSLGQQLNHDDLSDYNNNVIITRWAKEHGYDGPQLGKTTRADRSQPPSKTNVYSHKGIYAVYIKDKSC